VHLTSHGDRRILAALALTFQAVYLAAIPLGFECDAATFYSYAKAIAGAGGAVSAERPPLFPLFLVLTGTVWPGTFAFVIPAQAALGVGVPLLTYEILRGLGRGPALAGALLAIVSTIPFVTAKLILAEQLYTFLMLVTVLCLARYQDHREPRWMYGFVLAALAAMLTRWEALFLVVCGVCALVVLARRQAGHVRHWLAAMGLLVVALGGYSVARARALGDMQLVGTLQSGTGMQLFFRVYTMYPRALDTIVSDIFGGGPPSQRLYGEPVSLEEPGLAPLTACDENCPAPLPETPQLVNPANGPATRQLREVVAAYVRAHPDTYRGMKPGLDRLVVERDAPPEGAYEELFGRFDGDPEALADQIFKSPVNLRTAQYPLYVAGVAHEVFGRTAGDRLLLAAAVETIRAYPRVLVAMVAHGFTLTGLSLHRLAAVMHRPASLETWTRLFPTWGYFDYSRVGFDLGGCASTALPPRMMAEYRFDQRMTKSSFADAAIAFAAFGRNLVRACCGAVFVFGWWVLFTTRRRGLDLSVLITLVCVMCAVGIFAMAGANSKYDTGFIPLLVIAAVSIATAAVRLIGRKLLHAPVAERL
jgi:hypothetical protein